MDTNNINLRLEHHGNDNNTIKLETLLNEFYSDRSSNNRKREIEIELSAFNDIGTYFDFIVFNLDNINNKLVWFFKISCLENAIIKENLDPIRQKYLNDILWRIYKEIPINSPKIQRDKIAQLIILLMKQNFQTNDEELFLDKSADLIKNKFLYGIILFRTLSEEVFSTKSNICVQKREYLRLCFSLKLKPIFTLLHYGMKWLITIYDSHGTNAEAIRQLQVNEYPFNETIIEFLACVQHLFLWVPLDDFVTEYFLEKLFKLSTINYTHQNETSLNALTTICELFYRQTALPLPHQITNDIINLLDPINLTTIDEQYNEKFTELLTLFTSQTKWIEEKKFDLLIYRLYQYTTEQNFNNKSLEFSNKMPIWKSIIKVHLSKGFNSHMDLLLKLVAYILREQLLLNLDSKEIILDNNNLDDDMTTDWKRFINPCIELIVLIAERQPMLVIKILYEFWIYFYEILIKMKTNDINLIEKNLNTESGIKMLRNMSTLSQTLAIIPNVIEDRDRITDIFEKLLGQFQNVAQIFSNINRHEHNNLNFQLEVDNLTAQLLSAINSLLPIGNKLNDSNENLKSLLDYIIPLVKNCSHEPNIIQLEAAQLLLTISSNIRPKCLIEYNLIRCFMDQSYDLNELSKKLLNKSSTCHNVYVPVMVYQTICNVLLLPWTDATDAEQFFEQRNHQFNLFINELSKDLMMIEIQIGNEEIVFSSVFKSLPILTEILIYYQDSNSQIKQKLMFAFKIIFIKSVSILNTFNDVGPLPFDCIMNFTMGIIRTLQNQLSLESVKEMLDIVLTATLRNQNITNQLKSIDKILQILAYIIEKPGNVSRNLYPNAVRFALDHVMPMMQNKQTSKYMDNVALSLYKLFDCILQNKWNHFYNSQVLNGGTQHIINIGIGSINNHNNIATTATGNGTTPGLSQIQEKLKYEEDFLNIFMSYGFGIINWNDPEIKQLILLSMQQLNERRKLYQRDYFKKNLLLHFLNAFIKTIMSVEGSLHYELLVNIIYTMGMVDKLLLRQAFIDYGYPNDSIIVGHILNATDLPTFAENMNKLVYDTKLYKNLNNTAD